MNKIFFLCKINSYFPTMYIVVEDVNGGLMWCKSKVIKYNHFLKPLLQHVMISILWNGIVPPQCFGGNDKLMDVCQYTYGQRHLVLSNTGWV